MHTIKGEPFPLPYGNDAGLRSLSRGKLDHRSEKLSRSNTVSDGMGVSHSNSDSSTGKLGDL